MRRSKCRIMGHNKIACSLNRTRGSSNVSESATQVEWPSPPAASVSFTIVAILSYVMPYSPAKV